MRITKLVFFIAAIIAIVWFSKVLNQAADISTTINLKESSTKTANIKAAVSKEFLRTDETRPDIKIFRYTLKHEDCSLAWDIIIHLDLGFKNYHLSLNDLSEECSRITKENYEQMNIKIMTKIYRDWNYKRIFQLNFPNLKFFNKEINLEDLYVKLTQSSDKSRILFENIKDTKALESILATYLKATNIEQIDALSDNRVGQIQIKLEAL